MLLLKSNLFADNLTYQQDYGVEAIGICLPVVFGQSS